jgi:hypothetical protein
MRSYFTHSLLLGRDVTAADRNACIAARLALKGQFAYQSGNCDKAAHYAKLAAKWYNKARLAADRLGGKVHTFVYFDKPDMTSPEHVANFISYGPAHAAAQADQTMFHSVFGEGTGFIVPADANDQPSLNEIWVRYDGKTDKWTIEK